MTSDRDYMEANRKNWDERVAVHVASNFYDVASFKAGKSSLLPVELREVGDVQGKTLLHLQCHFGMDTLSWARAGASVTGVDFSLEAITTARGLAADLAIQASFVESNIYDLPSNLGGQFDIVFTSYGVLCWLPDIAGWARVAARFVKPGGFFYIIDGHPMSIIIWDEPYFGAGATAFEEGGTYTDSAPDVQFENKLEYEFQHTLGEIITALIDAGLHIEFVHEFPFTAWAPKPEFIKGDDGYYLPPEEGKLPYLFSLKAPKPA